MSLRFHVQTVEGEFVDTRSLYHDACLLADAEREMTGNECVVIDSKWNKVIYDSRKLSKKPKSG